MRGPDTSLPVWLQTVSPLGLTGPVECHGICPTVQRQQRTVRKLTTPHFRRMRTIIRRPRLVTTPHLCHPVLTALGGGSVPIMRGPDTSLPVWLQTGAPLGLTVPVECHGICPTVQRQQPSVNDILTQGGEWTNYRDVVWIFTLFPTTVGTSSQQVTWSST
jgi:hypothetical protein